MKRWLIGFDDEGVHRLGSDFSQATELKTLRSWKKHAELMKKARKAIDHIYMITDSQWNQKACEMTGEEFGEYVKKVGTFIL